MRLPTQIISSCTTSKGLQQLLMANYLGQTGLFLNTAKCMNISLKGQQKQKNSVLQRLDFTIDNHVIPALDRTETWTYLGVEFSRTGKFKFNPLDADVILRSYHIPRLYHRITLSSLTISNLNRTDIIIKHNIPSWLNLLHDYRITFFHAPGGDARRWLSGNLFSLLDGPADQEESPYQYNFATSQRRGKPIY